MYCSEGSGSLGGALDFQFARGNLQEARGRMITLSYVPMTQAQCLFALCVYLFQLSCALKYCQQQATLDQECLDFYVQEMCQQFIVMSICESLKDSALVETLRVNQWLDYLVTGSQYVEEKEINIGFNDASQMQFTLLLWHHNPK